MCKLFLWLSRAYYQVGEARLNFLNIEINDSNEFRDFIHTTHITRSRCLKKKEKKHTLDLESFIIRFLSFVAQI